MVEIEENRVAYTYRPWTGLAAGLGLLLPFGVIVLSWTLASSTIREPYNPDGDRGSDRVIAAILGSEIIGVLVALSWAWSHPRSAIWWVVAGVVLVAQVVAVFAFNLWYYLSVGGAFP